MTPSGSTTAVAAAARTSGEAWPRRSSAPARRSAACRRGRRRRRRYLAQQRRRRRQRLAASPHRTVAERARHAERGPEPLSGGADERELLDLSLRHEAREAEHARDFRQGAKPALDRPGGRCRGGDDVDGVGRPVGIGGEIREGRHQLDLRALEMQRVEVEAHEGQRRRRRDRDDEAQAEHAATMAAQGSSRSAPAGQSPLPSCRRRRPQQRQQGRQQGDGEREGDGHAEAGDQAELGDADIVGRQEGEEARADRGGGHRQRQADAAAGGDQGLLEVRDGSAARRGSAR